MIIDDIFKYSMSNLWNRKLRSFLSILSILIGIASIYALVSFGQGLEKYIDDFAQQQGTDKIIMQPGGFTPPGTTNNPFTESEVDFVRKISGVNEATGWKATTSKVKYKDYPDKYLLTFGFATDSKEQKLVEEIATVEVEEGRNLKKGDTLKVLLGHNHKIDDKIYPKGLKVGDKIEVNDRIVEVIGFYEEVGNPQDDSQLYFSFDGFDERFDVEGFEYVAVRSAVGEDPSIVADKIKEKLREHRGLPKGQEDFTVQTFEDAIAAFTSVILILNAVLVLIALISVVVAAVNIANTMYASILERTREIGVMKAIGAKNRFILFIFMFESGMLGLIGGGFGVLLGYLIAKLGQFAAAAGGLTFLAPYFPLWLTIDCLIFAFLVGALSGLFPSLQASKLKPVDALRYE